MTNEDLKALLDAAETVQNEGKYDEAEQLAIKALALLTSSGEDSDSFVKRATLEEMKPEEILWITGEIGTQANDTKHRARIFRILGNVARLRGNYFAALDHYAAALAIGEAINNREGIAKVMTDFGLVYQNLSDYTQALEYYQKALAIFKESGNNIGIANNLGNIGGVYQSMSDHANALEYYKLALKIFEESGSKMGIARNFTNIGIVSHNLADYAQALEYYQKALAIYEEFGRKDGIAICLGNIGTAYVELSDYAKALEYYNIAMAINEELGSKEGVAINLGNLGANYANPKFDGYNAAKAEEHLLRAITIDQEIGVKRHLYVLHQFLAALYRNEKRWEEADKNFQIYHDMEKEVQSEEAKKQVRLMEQRRQAEEQAKQIAIVKARHEATEQLLHNVLPPKIAHKILDGSKLIAEKLSGVSVLFADIVDFTKLSQRISPEELVEGLDGIFSEFDTLAGKHGLEKIKTIGDAYMVVAGAPEPREDHAAAMAVMAVEMIVSMKKFRAITTGEEIQLRIGIHSGEVVAGVIGRRKFAYDLWGDTVNTAARMESHGEAGKIHVTEEFIREIGTTAAQFRFEERGEMNIKGKGMMKTYFLEKK